MRSKLFFVSVLCFVIGSMLAAPSLAMGNSPRVAGAQSEITLNAAAIPIGQHVRKVQEAVDNYHIVNLIGTFNFGQPKSNFP